jgi:hypothetical protein
MSDLAVSHEFEHQVDVLLRRLAVVYHLLQTHNVLVFALLEDSYLCVDLVEGAAAGTTEFPARRGPSRGPSS